MSRHSPERQPPRCDYYASHQKNPNAVFRAGFGHRREKISRVIRPGQVRGGAQQLHQPTSRQSGAYAGQEHPHPKRRRKAE